MDLLYAIFIDPFMQMGQAPDLLVQTLWEGLVSGVLYATSVDLAYAAMALAAALGGAFAGAAYRFARERPEKRD